MFKAGQKISFVYTNIIDNLLGDRAIADGIIVKVKNTLFGEKYLVQYELKTHTIFGTVDIEYKYRYIKASRILDIT